MSLEKGDVNSFRDQVSKMGLFGFYTLFRRKTHLRASILCRFVVLVDRGRIFILYKSSLIRITVTFFNNFRPNDTSFHELWESNFCWCIKHKQENLNYLEYLNSHAEIRAIFERYGVGRKGKSYASPTKPFQFW